jgi:peptidoglycan/xylan/chitin deacetylase (PgdA/CDA1 family)
MANDNKTLAILAYHKIGKAPGGWDTWFYIPEDVFVEQLRYLLANRWQVIDVAAFLRGLETPESLPTRAALVTFDDGCRQFLDVALPWLRRLECPAVHFVPTDYIGKQNSFDAGIEPEEPILDWDDLRMVESWGVSIQSHATSHRPFSELSLAQQEEELRQSRTVLEEGLKKQVELFAFPQGDEGTDAAAIGRIFRQTGYRAAFLYGGGPFRLPVTTPYRLTRLAMGPDTDLAMELGSENQGDH